MRLETFRPPAFKVAFVFVRSFHRSPTPYSCPATGGTRCVRTRSTRFGYAYHFFGKEEGGRNVRLECLREGGVLAVEACLLAESHILQPTPILAELPNPFNRLSLGT